MPLINSFYNTYVQCACSWGTHTGNSRGTGTGGKMAKTEKAPGGWGGLLFPIRQEVFFG